MEQTALRPKPLPGRDRWTRRDRREPGHSGPDGPARRPHAARRRGRRLRTLLFCLATSTALVLCGVGLGTVGTSLTGRGGPAGAQRHTPPSAAPGAPAAAVSGASPRTMAALGPAETRPGASLGLEAVDARDVGALVTAVHTPGPGYTAGLVRGDILLQFGAARIDTAADLARAVAHAGPGTEVTVTVRHRSGNFQQLTVVPGVVI